MLNANKNQLSEKDYFHRIQMMIDLYFPELNSYFNKVLESRDNVYSFCSESFPPGTGPEDLIRAQEEFRKTGKHFMQRIADITHSL